ncbi:MAG: glycosyltransferase family 2 protein [Pseudomonadota bacterium]|jgi:glycosyltransferase involved in cell wall biosynthesis
MKYLTALRDHVRNRIELIENVDLVVGIPCYNNQSTIGNVVRQVSRGLHAYYPDKKCVIVVSDGGSVDDSREEAKDVEVYPFQEMIVTIYRGVPGKGSALRAVLELARFLKAEACVVVDSDLRSINAHWVRNLLHPIIEGKYQFVAPYYKRFKLDGTITNNIVYNMTRALYGKRVRQPIGGDFAFSRDVVDEIYDHDVWDTDVGRFGIDIWLTTTALVKGFNVCQTRLGAKVHDAKDPGASLGPMFRQVVATLFSLTEENRDYWWDIRGSDDIPVVGEEIETEPEPFPIDVNTLVDSFRNGYRQFGTLWETILSETSFKEVKGLAEDGEGFEMDDHKWAHILYDAAATYHCWPMNRFKLVELLTPLYYARVASFARIVDKMDAEEAEAQVEKQAKCFEDEKEYLLEQWELADQKIQGEDPCRQVK